MPIGAAGTQLGVGAGTLNYIIQSELGVTLKSAWSINAANSRTLSGTSVNTAVGFNNFYGKSYTKPSSPTYTPVLTEVWSNNSTQMQVYWNAVPTAEYYYIQYWNPVDGWTNYGFAYTNSGTIPGLTPNKIYYFYISSYQFGAYSGQSNNIGARTLNNPPTGLTATPTSRKSITISWTHPTDAAPPTKYRIYAKKIFETAYQYTLFAEVNYPTNSIVASPLYGNMTYNAYVVSVNGDGVNSIPSSVATQATFAASVPSIAAIRGDAPNDGVSVIITLTDAPIAQDRLYYVSTFYRTPGTTPWTNYQLFIPVWLYSGQSSTNLTVYTNQNNTTLLEIVCEVRDYDFPWVSDQLSNIITRYL
jgi:hypothetical protein